MDCCLRFVLFKRVSQTGDQNFLMPRLKLQLNFQYSSFTKSLIATIKEFTLTVCCFKKSTLK